MYSALDPGSTVLFKELHSGAYILLSLFALVLFSFASLAFGLFRTRVIHALLCFEPPFSSFFWRRFRQELQIHWQSLTRLTIGNFHSGRSPPDELTSRDWSMHCRIPVLSCVPHKNPILNCPFRTCRVHGHGSKNVFCSKLRKFINFVEISTKISLQNGICLRQRKNRPRGPSAGSVA